ncbi:MAG: Trk system potassium transporter TrkA [Lachnospiraceae bacterium]|nr:Trk system potassium transporter TrkA [Lachnospiraceae bacterium]
MNIIIVGCGNVGYALSEKLRAEKHNIVVIDKDKNKIDVLTEEQDVLGIVGDGVNYQVLLRAGIEHTDLLIAVTGSDEQNLLCCVMAKRSDRYCRTIARVRNPVYNTETSYLRRELGLAMIINPELIASAEIARKFQYPDAVSVDTFARGRTELLHLIITKDSPLVSMTVASVRTKFKCNILICAIQRKRDIFIPSPDEVLSEDDELILSATPKDATHFFYKTGVNRHPLKSAMIVGGSTIGFYLAKRLLETGVRTKILESDEERCHFLNEELPRAVVINGDGSDERLLLREGLGGVGAFASLTGIDEENVLLTLFARRVSHARTITKLHRLNYSDVMQDIQLDHAVFPGLLTADYIVKYARSMQHNTGGNIENIFPLKNKKAKALVYFITENSPVTNVPLSQLNLKPDLIICSITRNERVLIPTGRDEIRVGDNVLILSIRNQYNDIKDILET